MGILVVLYPHKKRQIDNFSELPEPVVQNSPFDDYSSSDPEYRLKSEHTTYKLQFAEPELEHVIQGEVIAAMGHVD